MRKNTEGFHINIEEESIFKIIFFMLSRRTTIFVKRQINVCLYFLINLSLKTIYLTI